MKTTFLGAHALPAEFKGRPDAYIDFVCDVLPRADADAVDAFCEGIGFSVAQTRKVFDKAVTRALMDWRFEPSGEKQTHEVKLVFKNDD